MKATLRYTLMGLTFAGLTFLSTSCRKDLCYDHDEHGLSVKVNLSSDWEQEWERTYAYDWEKLWEEDWKYDYEDLCPAPADGIRVQVYTSDGQRIAVSYTHLDVYKRQATWCRNVFTCFS